MHGGTLWLDRAISIYIELIARITGLPSAGEDPARLFPGKGKDKELADKMMNKYGTERGACGLKVALINNDSIKCATQVLAYKLLRKYRPYEVSGGVIAAAEMCVEGVQ